VIGPNPTADPGTYARIEPLFMTDKSLTSPLLGASRIRVPYRAQPVMEQRPPSVPTWQSVLVECGEPFGKTLPEAGGYTATAFSLAGGFFELPDETEISWPAQLTLLDTVLVSAGGGTGIECQSGGCLSGARTTNLDAYHSCLYGFDTDVKRDTSGSWQTQPISDVYYVAEPLERGLRLPSDSGFQIGTGGSIKVWGYNSWNENVASEMVELATIEQDGGYSDGKNGAYDNTIIVLTGEISHTYTEVHDGATPIVPVYLRFRETETSLDYITLYITLPGGISLEQGDAPLVFLVGSNGETFQMPGWDNRIDTIVPTIQGNPPLREREELLASEWVEMWLRGTAFRRLVGQVSVDPAVHSK